MNSPGGDEVPELAGRMAEYCMHKIFKKCSACSAPFCKQVLANFFIL